jgi:ADP-heptose:LPS heptosyltransferase
MPALSTPSQIVVLRALGLGDLLTAVPALRGLRRAHPDAQLTLAAPGWQEPLARLVGIDTVADTGGLDDVRSPGHHVDLAVNLHGRGPQSTAALRAMHPRALIAYGGLVPWDPDEHEVSRWCRLLVEHAVPADPSDLRLSLPDTAGPVSPGSVIIHPGASVAGRRWPPARFAAVARALLDQGDRVTFTGTTNEAELCLSIAAAAQGGTVLAGRTSVMELAGAVRSASAVLSNDTGVAHLASALGSPSVVMFGPDPPSRWGPPTEGPHIAIWKGILGDPRSERLDPGLEQISVTEVLAALGKVRRPAGWCG